jgi:hypothetical protein
MQKWTEELVKEKDNFDLLLKTNPNIPEQAVGKVFALYD